MVFGALRRTIREPSIVYGLTLATGLSLLALSRPFEGLIVTLPTAAVLAYHIICRKRIRLASLRHVVVPIVALVGLTLTLIGLYNWRVTGNQWTFPYVVHNDQYSMTSGFLWSEPRSPPQYRHTEIERYYRTWGVERTEAYQDPRTFVRRSTIKTLRNLVFFLGPGLILLLFLRRAARDPWLQFSVIVSGGVLLISLATGGSYPHYVAPVTGLIYVVLGACLTEMQRSASDSAARVRRMTLVLIAFGIYPLIGFTPVPEHDIFAADRLMVRGQLLERAGQDLVIVRYGPDHNPHHEWVYNAANLKESEIIWARDMGPSANRRLMEVYSDRKVWLLLVDGRKVELSRFRLGPDEEMYQRREFQGSRGSDTLRTL